MTRFAGRNFAEHGRELVRAGLCDISQSGIARHPPAARADLKAIEVIVDIRVSDVASQAPEDEPENPVLWFLKLALTGVGGLAELKRRR